MTIWRNPMKEKADQAPLRVASWTASMSIRPLKWILLGPVLALLLLGHGFGAEWPAPCPGQPEQMWSQVDYDPKLTDPFFESNEGSYQDYDLKGTPLGKRPKQPSQLKHTAKCFTTALGYGRYKDLVRFCEARLLDVDMMDLFIHESNPAYDDSLGVRIRNGMFTCQFSTSYKYRRGHLMWTTKRQKLTLDKKAYRKGDVIKGRIDFECVEEEITDLKGVAKSDRNPTTIMVNGVFKTVIE